MIALHWRVEAEKKLASNSIIHRQQFLYITQPKMLANLEFKVIQRMLHDREIKLSVH